MARTGPHHWTIARGLAEPAAVVLSPAARDRIVAALAPHLRDGIELSDAMARVGVVLAAFAADDAAGMGARAMPRAGPIAREIGAVAAAAARLRAVIEALGPDARPRLWRAIGAPLVSVLADEGSATPSEELAVDSPELHDLPAPLAALAIDLEALERRLAAAAAEIRAEPRPVGRPADYAARRLARQLAHAWRDLTGTPPARARRGSDGPSPYEAFGFACFSAAGAGSGARLLRETVPAHNPARFG